MGFNIRCLSCNQDQLDIIQSGSVNPVRPHSASSENTRIVNRDDHSESTNSSRYSSKRQHGQRFDVHPSHK